VVSRTIRTAPSRNSGSNFRRVSGMSLLLVHASTVLGEVQLVQELDGPQAWHEPWV
jgi:hypothetical protein